MNKIELIGNLTRDPELTQTAGGIAYCKFSIAVNRRYKDENGENIVDFFPVTTWRGIAENVVKYCRKGNKVAVIGSLETRSYNDKDGKAVKVFEVNAEEVEFLTARKPEPAAGDPSPSPAKPAAPAAQSGKKKRGPESCTIVDESLPF